MTHAAAGQVHIRPFLDPADPADAANLRPLADALYSLVFEMGGTISAQHGTGIARTPWVERQYGPLYDVFRQIKRIFDPENRFNPGKIVGPSAAWPLRYSSQFQKRNLQLNRPNEMADESANGAAKETGSGIQVLGTALHWETGELQQQIHACNGCGPCRAGSSPLRMCPIFRVKPEEAATPRAKANLLRHILADPDPQRVSADDVRAVADLCVNC